MNYHWNWTILSAPAPDGSPTYLLMLLSGAMTTVLVAACAAVLAILLGVPLGIARRIGGPIAGLAAAYVEVFRNIPLLAQMVLWYFVFPELLPTGLQTLAKQSSHAPFVLGTLSLGLYTAARICEQVRSALGAIPRGQSMAGLALGLRPVQLYRYVLLPRAFRMIVPTLTSEFISIVKNSAVLLTIGVMELTASARAMQEFSFQVFEAFLVATALYLSINFVIVALMNLVERRLVTAGVVDGISGRRGSQK